MHPTLEVCAFGIESCLVAAKAGAARVELCDNPLEGGTTPSIGTISIVRSMVDIELYPIIRPRALNYCYDEYEWRSMLTDIEQCKAYSCDGISVGVQLPNGRLDVDRMKKIVELAYPMGVTCNRVIDACPDPFEALEELIAAGCERVLTSGQAATATEGAAVLQALIKQANGRISIMPGAGINASNIVELYHQTGASEFHASARKPAVNKVSWHNSLVTDTGNMYVADKQAVAAMVSLLNEINLH